MAAITVYLYSVPSDANRNDVRLRDPTTLAGGFPTQFAGLRTVYQSAVRELCLVAVADAPTGMGGVLRIVKNGTTYAVYLVETTDPNATPVRVRTTTGTKAIRVKT
jgi:hypothetical protein